MVAELFTRLKELKINVRLVEGRLDLQAPKGVLNEELLNEIKTHKEDLIHFINSYRNRKDDFHTIQKIALQDSYELSASQRTLWVLSQYTEGNVAYNMAGAYVFEGALDTAALSAAFDILIERHENLRTVFREDEQGDIKQWILQPEAIGFAVALRDMRHASTDALHQEVQAAALSPFDLATGPLFRAGLYQVADQKWVFGYVMHHIISDGWSMGILIRELLHLYNALIQGRPHTLPPLRIQYKDYAAWHRQEVSGPNLQLHKNYWLQQFAGEIPVLELVSDKPRPAFKTFRGAYINTKLNATLSEGMRTLSQNGGATLFMGLTAAVNALLYRYTGQEDIVIGTPSAGRSHPDLEDQIGFYVNTLALRTQFSKTDSFLQLLEKVKTTTLGANEHQVFHFAEIVEALQLKRDMSRNPLFDVQVILGHHESGQMEEQRMGNLHVSAYEQGVMQTARFDMVFNFNETGPDLHLNVQYNSDVYTEQLVWQLTAHLEQLIAAVLRNPALSLQELDYLTPGDKQQLLVEFNGGAAPVPPLPAITVTDIFRKQAAATPDAVAVLFEQTTLTYRELDEKSDQLAHFLISNHQVKADERVGILLERSEKMFIAIWGILKAGAAYVPIDPEYPEARKSFILKDSGIKLLLTQTDYIFDLEDYDGEVFAVDVQLDDMDTPATPPEINITPQQLAYVIYTSGSTGNPKGVLIGHDNLIHSLTPRLDIYPAVRAFLLLSSIAFDSSVAGIFGTLCSGGRLCITRKIDVANVDAIAAYLIAQGVSHFLTVPSYYKLLLTALENKKNALEAVIVAGEHCPVQLVEHHFSAPALQQCAFYNEYGPTEGTVWSTVHIYRRDETPIATIGKPLPRTRIYILDERMQPVPAGVPGEMYIAGGGVARGYLDRPELTAEKFLPDPFHTGEKMYRTGDAARWNADGHIIFIGRKDDQIKIRGYRIELGEIENALQGHPDITMAAVAARPDSEGNLQLAAYVVSAGSLKSADLQTYLGSSLPAYAVPAHYVQLDQLPLTPNGKVDRRRLPDPKGAGMATGVPYVAPRNEMETKLAAIWEDILGREKIGINDSFFSMGGDSIKILRMMSEMRKKIALDVPVADIYQHHTIAQLLEHTLANRQAIDARNQYLQTTAQTVQAEMEALKTRLLAGGMLPDAGNIEDVFPMSDVEKGMVFESIVSKGKYVYHDQMVRQRIFVDFDIERLRKAMQLLVNKHAILRTAFNVNDSEIPVQIVYKQVPVIVPYKDLSAFPPAEQEAAVRRFTEEELEHPFDITAAPLWRLSAFHTGNHQVVFVWQCHHAIIDGWSDALLMTELNNLYVTLAEEPAYQPLPLASSYKDFIIQQQIDKKDEQLISFWEAELDDYKRLDIFGREPDSAFFSHALSATEAARIEKLAGNLGTSVKVITYTAYLYLLKVLNYAPEIVAGYVTNTRPGCEDSDKILGCFLNTVPFSIAIEEELTATALILQVQEKMVKLKDYERLSLPEIARIHQQQSDAGNPFFDTFFNYVDFHEFRSIREEAQPTGLTTPAPVMDVKGSGRTNTWFDFTINYTGGLLSIKFMLNRQLKSGMSADQLGALYVQILDFISSNPGQVINKRDYLSDADRNHLLQKGQGGSIPVPEKTLVQLFEEQVARTPSGIALVGQREWTYEILNISVNRMAHYLRTIHELQPGDMAGILLEKNEWAVIAILAVLKAGAAYVPVDTDYPEARIRYIQENSACKVMIDAGFVAAYRDTENDWPGENPEPVNRPEDLAYVIYTSGSTGHPKGVLIEQRSVVNLVCAQLAAFEIRTTDNILQFSSIAFDASVEQIFMALSSGARLTLIGKDTRVDPEQLAAFIDQHKITHIHTVPDILKTLPVRHYPSLRSIIAGGDACPPALAKQWNGHHAFYNEYGPTETTVTATVFHYHGNYEMVAALPIGRPVANTHVYIMDHLQNLVPEGVTGEICIGGNGVARGYLQRPDLTAEKFVPDPFRKGQRLYRTGDLGRWLPDGNIAFLGRQDDQVKIRGFRIETGEITACLQTHPDISAAVVIARSGELVAYIVTKNGPLPLVSLRAWLGERLPAHMLPAQVVQLDALPLNAHGKIDRKQLPDPDSSLSATGTPYIAPRNKMETLLTAAYETVLKKQPVGISGDFFVLGGDSIKSIQIVSYLKQQGYTLTIQEVLSHPVIEDLAPYMTPVRHTIDQGIVTGPVSLSPVQAAFFEQGRKDLHHHNQSVLLVSKEPVDTDALQAALDKIVLHHDALRMVYHQSPAGWEQELKGAEQTYDLIIQDYINETTYRAACDQLQAGIHLETGPLMKVALFRHPEGDRLLLIVHHLVVDGVSWRILLEDLSALYHQYRLGAALHLPLKTDAFSYWQEKQMAFAHSKTLQQEIPYWSAVANAPVAPLPMDFPQGTNEVKDVAVQHFQLNETMTERLLTQCYKAYRTEVNDVLLTALGMALQSVFGLNKVMLQLEGHGREAIGTEIDVSRTVGWFTTMYPVLLDLQHAAHPADQLVAVKETLHRVPNKGIGYGVLRYLAGMPLAVAPSITFNYLGDFGSGAAAGGTELFTFSGEYHGREYSVHQQRHTLLDVSGMVVGGRIRLTIGYSAQQFKEDTMARLSAAYEQQLLLLIGQLSAITESYLTPSDLTFRDLRMEEVTTLNAAGDLEDVYPLTDMQRVMVAEYNSDQPGSGIYHSLSAWRFKDEHFSLPALQAAIRAVQLQHGALRSTFFSAVDGNLYQCIRKTPGDTVVVEDLSRLTVLEQQQRMSDAVREDLQHKFEVNKPLARFRILLLSDTSFELMFSCHHAVMDGWGFTVFRNELMKYYLDARDGNSITTTSVKPAFREYIQLSAATTADEQAAAFWREVIKDVPPLPLSPAITPDDGTINHSVDIQLDAATGIHLQEQAAAQKVSLRALLLTACRNALQEEWGVAEVPLGVVFNGRTEGLPDGLQALGLFWNMLPFRLPAGSDNSAVSVQQQLNRSEEFNRYSPWQIREQLGREANQVSFSFAQFHNAVNWDEAATEVRQGLPQLEGDFFMDRYHYPLNVKVTVKGHQETIITIILDYNPKYLSKEKTTDILTTFVNHLKS